MSPGGRHGHTIREIKRRIDVVLEEERERRRPPPPPVSAEHAAIRERIERAWAEVVGQIPDGMDLNEAVRENPALASEAARVLMVAREERDFLLSHGVDPRPWGW